MFSLKDNTVRRVLDAGSVATHFQPLVSLRRNAVFAVEALCRATDPDTGRAVPPQELFSLAGNVKTRLELDRLCRQRALEAFAPLYRSDPGLILSLNVDASVIDSSCVHSQVLSRQVADAGIPPENVAIEIIESRAGSALALMEFVVDYKRRGFIIALDDLGAGHSNLDRIHLLQPDVLKLDRSLITRIDHHFHKQEVVKSFVRLASRTGCMVLGEGVERQEEALALLECGVDVFQGYFFGRPTPAPAGWDNPALALFKVAEAHKKASIKRLNAEKIRHSSYHTLVGRLCARLATPGPATTEQRLAACLEEDSQLECLYLLNMDGTQISETVCHPDRLCRNRRLLYAPAAKGADHSCKEYYLPLRSGLSRFTTEPYLSQASGSRCITISTVCAVQEGMACILCTDLACD
ncbi:MAG: EAL domain-containing protein [Desulfovibrionaceae bacterium]